MNHNNTAKNLDFCNKKRKVCVITLVVILISFICYTSLWIAAAYHINGVLTNSPISFRKIKTYGFPFKIEFKLSDVNYQNTNSQFADYIKLGYDVTRNKIYISHGDLKIGNNESIFSKDISSIKSRKFIINVPLKSRVDIFRILSNDEHLMLHLINSIESASFSLEDFSIAHPSGAALEAKRIDIDAKIPFTGRKYYNNYNELLTNIPSTYELSFDKSMYKLHNFFDSTIYDPVILKIILKLASDACDVKTKITLSTTEKVFDLQKIIKNIEVTFSSDTRYNELNLNSNQEFFIKIHSPTESRINIDTNMNAIFSNDITGFIRGAIEDSNIDEHISKNLLNMIKTSENETQEITTKFDINGSIQTGDNHESHFHLKNFSCAFSNNKDVNSGFSVSSNISFSKSNLPNIDINGQVALNQYRSIIDTLFFIVDLMPIQDKPRTEDYITSRKEALSDVLRYISNHPESKSPDIMLDYQYKFNLDEALHLGYTNNVQNMIGKYPLNQMADIYTTMLYKNVMILAQRSPNVVTKIKEMLPDISQDHLAKLVQQSKETVVIK